MTAEAAALAVRRGDRGGRAATAASALEFAPAREGLAKLVGTLLDHPDVDLIDLGSDRAAGRPLLRVYLRTFAALSRLELPGEVDGVTVQLALVNYPLRG